MRPNNLLFLLLMAVFLGGCQFSKSAATATENRSRIAFYNVENLFDTVDDPKHADEDFTPEGRQQWTAERYQKKLDQIARVLEEMIFPDFVGLCEVENKKVLTDLINTASLKQQQYQIVHFDSPDYRGIDVALLYDSEQFSVKSAMPIAVDIPDAIEPDYTTRDILQVFGIFKKKYPLYLFINHWSSRRGGLTKSEPKRLYASEQLQQAVAAVLEKDKNAAIIIMGDMNDETDNKSITEILQARKLNDSVKPQQLYNCFSEIDAQQLGSYNFRGNWNMLDQIIVSSTLINSDGLQVASPTVFQQDWMIYQHERFGNVPNRTYGGPNYYGGTSDHFPVYVDLIW